VQLAGLLMAISLGARAGGSPGPLMLVRRGPVTGNVCTSLLCLHLTNRVEGRWSHSC
jgi:hypothetical protein